MTGSDPAWSMMVAVEDVPPTGQHFDLAADAGARTALAGEIGLRALPRVEASFDVSRHGESGLRVRGRVSASVGQNCVVTLDPIDTEVVEDIDLVFAPEPPATLSEEDQPISIGGRDPPEPLRDGRIDLAAIATEFLILGIDPYPRKPDVVFEPLPAGEPASHPFAALAALKTGDRGGNKP